MSGEVSIHGQLCDGERRSPSNEGRTSRIAELAAPLPSLGGTEPGRVPRRKRRVLAALVREPTVCPEPDGGSFDLQARLSLVKPRRPSLAGP